MVLNWEELRFVDYCNNCKTHRELGLDESCTGEFAPCHHYWYCWNDGGVVQDLQMKILGFKSIMKSRRLFPSEYKEYQRLLRQRENLVTARLRIVLKELQHGKR